jgi:hypothetical protein
MRKNTLKIAIICLTIAISLTIYGLCYAGPECRTYGMVSETGDHYQIEFDCRIADGFLGVLELKNNGEVMLERVYLFLVDPETGEPTVFIPRVCKLAYRDAELVYQDFDMIFRAEPE